MESTYTGKLLKCIVCGVALSSPFSYHKHNIRQHSHEQLSRAILKLQQLQLPLNDPTFDDEDDDDEEQEEERKRLEFDMADVLDLPLKCELMDEEVIELGPTENADNLEVQSRLVKNPDDTIQQSRQIIEVQENQPPPACYMNPAVEDPDAIVVKFNRELVMALDNTQPTACTPIPSKKKQPNRNLRATFKTHIEIPDPRTASRDYKPSTERSCDKYVMQSVILMDKPLKRRRGRPRKTISDQPVKNADKQVEMAEDEDLDTLADPVLFTDNEEEEATVAAPNVTRSRSGRVIKIKKRDSTYDYYDARNQENTEESSSFSEWKPNRPLDGMKARVRRKRRISVGEDVEQNAVNKSSKLTPEITPEISVEKVSLDNGKSDEFLTENEEVEEGISMPLITHHIEDDTCISLEPSKSIDGGNDSFECILCCKSFDVEEDCEKHTQEHLRKEKGKSEEILVLNATCDDVNESLLHSDNVVEDLVTKEEQLDSLNKQAIINNKDIEGENQGISSSDSANASCGKNEEMLKCSSCDMTFTSKSEFHKHSHETSRKCPYCGKKYRSRLNLQLHIKKYHKETDWMKFKCATCGKSFGFLLALERHMKEHNPNQKFCCEQCGKVFKNLINLKNHIPLHTKEEVFECPYCPKQYYSKHSYEKHLKTHESNPRYSCEICDRRFMDKNQLEKHLQRHRMTGSHGRSKDYKCNNCGDIKSGSDLDIVGITDAGHHKTCVICSKGLYKRYRYIVGDVDSKTSQVKDERRREQCKICGKFVLNLQRHIRITHLGAEYVSCDLCGLVVTKASLASHKNRRHGGTKVTCDHCNQTFKNVMCLREHMSKVRRKEDPSRNVCKFCKETVSSENWKDHMLKHKRKCSDCGAAHFSTHEEFLAHLDSCRRCSNCNLSTFESRDEFLNHIEICSSGIDVITSSLDSTSEQEVVTSIFAIVDGDTCEVCGIVCNDPELLSQHITESHPETLATEHVFSENSMINGTVLYACPKDSSSSIVASKDSLKSHIASIQPVGDGNVSDGASEPSGLEIGGRRYIYTSSAFKSLL